MKKTRKAQIQSNVLTYVIVGVMIFLFLIWGIKAIADFNARQKEILVKQFGEDLRESVASIEYGSVQETSLQLPPGITEVCIVDLSKREAVLTSPTIGRFPIMKSSIEGGFRKNVFLIKDDQVEETMYGGDICFANYPHHACMDVTQNLLNLFIEGKGRCALLVRDDQCKPIGGSTTSGVTTLIAHDATLTIPDGTVVSGTADTEVCLTTTPLPPEANNDGLISEVYNITPKGTTFDKDLTLKMKYYPNMITQGTKTENIKMLHYSSGATWSPFTTGSPGPNTNKLTVTKQGDIDPAKTYAIFGPQPPKVVIEVTGHTAPFRFDDGTVVNFDATSSEDTNPPVTALSYNWDFGGDGTYHGTPTTTASSDKPKYKYDEIGTYTVTLTATDSDGNVGSTTAEVKILNADNQRDSTKIKGLYLIKKTASNWKDILKMITLALWTDIDGRTEKPLVISDDDVESTDLAKLKARFSPTPDTVQDGIPSDTDYYAHWSRFEDLVVVDDDEDKDTALMAALYATSFNAPLVYDDETIVFPDTVKDHLDNDGATITIHAIAGVDVDDIKTQINALTTPPTITTKTLSASDIDGPPKNDYDEAFIETIPSNALP